MSLLLAIDTSNGTSVAIFRDGELVAQTNEPNALKHAESIGSAIANVLREANVRGADVAQVVVGRGPALFTGLRVGIAAAVMFAEGAGAKLSGVVSLDAIALEALNSGAKATETEPLLVSTDARRGERYWATYSGLDKFGVPVRTQGPQVLKPEAIENLFAVEGLKPQTTDVIITAKAIGELAIAQAKAGVLDSDVSALYLRAPDAVEPKSPGQFGKKVSS